MGGILTSDGLVVLGFGEIGRASGACGGKRGRGRPLLAEVSDNKAHIYIISIMIITQNCSNRTIKSNLG